MIRFVIDTGAHTSFFVPGTLVKLDPPIGVKLGAGKLYANYYDIARIDVPRGPGDAFGVRPILYSDCWYLFRIQISLFLGYKV